MDDFDERLRQRLSALDAAVPPAPSNVRGIGGTPSVRRGRGDRVASRLPIGLAAALAMVIVGAAVVGVGLRQGLVAGPASPSAPPPASVVPSGATTESPGPGVSPIILGSDGIPTQIDGQRVYRVTDQAEWQNLSGSFLLEAHIPGWPGSASCIVPSLGTPERDLLGVGLCGGWSLGSTTGSGLDEAGFVYAAPKSEILLYGWVNHAVVLRVHTHDSEAAQCSAARRAKCEAAIVVEAVVWPAVPSEINGERVYRGSDLRSMFFDGTYENLNGSFLLGGVVSVVTTETAPAASPGACVTAVVGRQALSQLLSDCSTSYVSIDSERIAPKSTFGAVDGQVVVVRAHMNDALAAQCPADVRTTCQEAIVVESVVWSSNPYPTATPTPALTDQPSGSPPWLNAHAGPTPSP